MQPTFSGLRQERPGPNSQTMRFLWLLWVGLFLGMGTALQAGAPAPQLSLRILVQSNQIANSAQTVAVPLTDPEETIYVNAIPEASEKDLIGVEPYNGPAGETGATLHFTSHAGLSFNADTMQNQGRILVVVLNGRVVYSPIIDSVISGGDFLIPHGVSPQDMALLQATAQINQKRMKE